MIEAADEDLTRPTPAALELIPDNPQHLDDVIEAFWALSRARRVVTGPECAYILPITPADAFVMAQEIGWDGMDFLRVIQPADALYVEEMNRRKAT